jgi:hypothetical protein
MPPTGSPLGVGAAAGDLLVEAIDRLKPEGGARREQELPHLVLNTCFVDGAKHPAAPSASACRRVRNVSGKRAC